MPDIEIPALQDIFVGEIAKNGNWIVANLETGISWPVSTQKYSYQSTDFFILPITTESYPAVAVRKGDESNQEARSKILRFLSAMSWTEASGVIVVSFGGGNLPRPLGRQKSLGLTITRDLNLTYLPEPTDDKGKLALALMREGRGLNHPAYAFLSFYRVLEAAIPNGTERGTWISGNLDRIFDRRGIESLAKLRASGIEDVGKHLYNSGRMAIAHAKAEPIVNPDDAADYDRIADELPIMRGLAELAIEEVVGIKTRHTIWREHLFELAGFKEIIGSGETARIAAGEPPKPDTTIDLPEIDIELRGKAPYEPLQRMQPCSMAQSGKCLQLVYVSRDGLVEMIFVLDFENERLVFDWQTGLAGHDDKSATAARYAADLNRFILEYVGNGELHIFDSDSRRLISRVDAFIPTNYWANHKVIDRQINAWREEAERRQFSETQAPS